MSEQEPASKEMFRLFLEVREQAIKPAITQALEYRTYSVQIEALYQRILADEQRLAEARALLERVKPLLLNAEYVLPLRQERAQHFLDDVTAFLAKD